MGKAIGGAIVTLVIAGWAGYHGFNAARDAWSTGREVQCAAFLAGPAPKPGEKLTLANCQLDFVAAAGVGFKFSDDAHTAFIPLAPRPAKPQWELALISEDEAMINAVRSAVARAKVSSTPPKISGVVRGSEGVKAREQFGGLRKRAVYFLDVPGTFHKVFGVAFLLLSLLLIVGAVTTVANARRASSSSEGAG
ncbi:MAG: hypothetical protein KC503_36400 [Myxococcales bacterium]|nr:hypothetical protein [Myxococcales bacterium]